MIDKISIMGVSYKVVEVPGGLEPDHLGDISESESTIRIRKGVAPQAQVSTILHEILHACLWSVNLDSSEATVVPLSNVLYSVLLMENPELISQLQTILLGETTHVSKKLPRKRSRKRRRP